MGIAFHLGENVFWVTASDEEEAPGPKLETQVYRLRQAFIPSLAPAAGGDAGEEGGGRPGEGAADTDLEDAIEGIMVDSPEGASYRVFRNRNLLMVRNSRENLRLIERLIAEFDRPPYQVLIEARFLTIAQDDLLELGAGISNSTNPPPAALDPNDPEQVRVSDFVSTLAGFSPENPSAGDLTLSGILGDRTYNLVISALAKSGSTRTISAPRVTVLNNQIAHIRKGDTVRYWDTLDPQSASGGGNGGSGSYGQGYSGQAQELELGVTLDVKVSVGNDGQTVLLGLQPKVKDIKEWRKVPVAATTTSGEEPTPLEVPDTTESEVDTTVAVRSGETVVLGGMVISTETKEVKKIPLLGDIPYLGFLFRHTANQEKPTHLLIFVSATVIDPSGRFVQVGGAGQ
jgi:type II secretory pathway component GspD/PulD (secretin)